MWLTQIVRLSLKQIFLHFQCRVAAVAALSSNYPVLFTNILANSDELSAVVGAGQSWYNLGKPWKKKWKFSPNSKIWSLTQPFMMGGLKIMNPFAQIQTILQPYFFGSKKISFGDTLFLILPNPSSFETKA